MTTVFLGDRDEIYRKALAHALSKLGYEVVEFTSGAELYARTITEEPDLILMETDLEEIDGFQVFARLQRRRAGQPFPVVFVAEFDHPQVARVCKERGALGYVGKSQPPEEVVRQLQSFLTLAASSAPGQAAGAVEQSEAALSPAGHAAPAPRAGRRHDVFDKLGGALLCGGLLLAGILVFGLARTRRDQANPVSEPPREHAEVGPRVLAAEIGEAPAAAGDARREVSAPPARESPGREAVAGSGEPSSRPSASNESPPAAGSLSEPRREPGRAAADSAGDLAKASYPSYEFLQQFGLSGPPGGILDPANSDAAYFREQGIAAAGRSSVFTFRTSARVLEVVDFYRLKHPGLRFSVRVVWMSGKFQGVRRTVARLWAPLSGAREAALTASRPGFDAASRRWVEETTVRIEVRDRTLAELLEQRPSPLLMDAVVQALRRQIEYLLQF